MAKFDITVTDEPVTDVEFVKKEYTVLVGDEFSLENGRDYTLEPEKHGTSIPIAGLLPMTEIVAVYESTVDVRVHWQKAGTATITLTVLNGDGTRVPTTSPLP